MRTRLRSRLMWTIHFVILLTISSFGQKKYYISDTDGNDTNNGTSAATAWKTLDKVSGINSISPGDTFFFKKGDIFYGSLFIGGVNGDATKPVVYTTYGTGDLPTFRASQKLTNWTVHSGNIWKTDLARTTRQTRVPSVFINNKPQTFG